METQTTTSQAELNETKEALAQEVGQKAQDGATTTPPQKNHETTTKVPIALDDSGLPLAKTLDEQYRIARALVASRMLPKHFDTPEKAWAGMQYAAAMKMPAILAMRQIAIINGTPSAWGELPLATVRNSGKLAEIEEFLIDKDYNKINFENKNLEAEPYAAICRVKREGETNFHETHFTTKDAEKANLWAKSGPWSNYPKRMLQMRARSQALKDTFPDVLSGLAIAEYDYNVTGESPEDVERQVKEVNKANELNKRYGVEDEEPSKEVLQ